MKRRPKVSGVSGTCAYCAAAGVRVEREHVFPDSWYPDGFPQDRMITVPSCTRCNRDYGRLEERLFWPLVAGFARRDAARDTIIARALRGLDPSAGRNVRDVAHRAVRRRRMAWIQRSVPAAQDVLAAWTPTPRDYKVVRTEGGLLVRGARSHEVQTEDLEALACKLVKGCYRAFLDETLASDAGCVGFFFDEDPTVEFSEVARRANLQRAGEWPFEVAFARNNAGATVWLFALWSNYAVQGVTVPAGDPVARTMEELVRRREAARDS